jgi:hypothetical protein
LGIQTIQDFGSGIRNKDLGKIQIGYTKLFFGSVGLLESSIQKTTVSSFEGFAANPKSLWGKSATEIKSIVGNNWTKGTYGSNGQGWKFTNGDKSLFFNASSSAHGGAEYYGFSSGALGKNKVVNPATYVPRAGDKATIFHK